MALDSSGSMVVGGSFTIANLSGSPATNAAVNYNVVRLAKNAGTSMIDGVADPSFTFLSQPLGPLNGQVRAVAIYPVGSGPNEKKILIGGDFTTVSYYNNNTNFAATNLLTPVSPATMLSSSW
ncbi:MAG: hypothetical protein EB082_16290 [Verrucomicrobia bacterium]|nr:hypothetical protein [Verrucomicrobiota bacterium]